MKNVLKQIYCDTTFDREEAALGCLYVPKPAFNLKKRKRQKKQQLENILSAVSPVSKVNREDSLKKKCQMCRMYSKYLKINVHALFLKCILTSSYAIKVFSRYCDC